MKNKIIAIIIGLILVIPISAQSQISLLETEKVNDYLTLNSQQSEKINPIIDQIKTILEEDKKILADLKERFNRGDEPGFFEKIGVKRGRDSRSGDIEDLIDDIEDHLNNEQKIMFKKINKPILNSLSKEEIFGKEE
ncbi:hypothetical protein [Ignavibacterium sp.]|uniref:hypothetical protein n=1 Tax=Ignavibacterium sp. TaxID=2651167 RepID=UPI00307F5663